MSKYQQSWTQHVSSLEDEVPLCPDCGSENCDLIHQDVVAMQEIILCLDCDREFDIDPFTRSNATFEELERGYTAHEPDQTYGAAD